MMTVLYVAAIIGGTFAAAVLLTLAALCTGVAWNERHWRRRQAEEQTDREEAAARARWAAELRAEHRALSIVVSALADTVDESAAFVAWERELADDHTTTTD